MLTDKAHRMLSSFVDEITARDRLFDNFSIDEEMINAVFDDLIEYAEKEYMTQRVMYLGQLKKLFKIDPENICFIVICLLMINNNYKHLTDIRQSYLVS